MTEPERWANVGADDSFAYRDYDDQNHSWLDVHELARDWWSDSTTRRAGASAWMTQAHPLVDDLLEEGHPVSIEVMQALVDEAGSDEELVFVGAGPLEDLLAHNGHSEVFVDEVERRARQQPRFRTAVSGLWLGQDVPASVRIRLCRLGATELGAAAPGKKARKQLRAEKERRGRG